MGKNILSDVKPKHYFWLNDGTTIKNLSELSGAMSKISDDIFRHHVSDQRNDFYNWVKDVHKDRKLAAKLLKAKTKEEIAEYIKTRIGEIGNVKKTKQKPIKKKTEKKQKVKITKVEKKLPEIKTEVIKEEKQLSDKPYTFSGTAIALATLIGLVVLVNLFGGPTITGAAVKDVSVSYDWFVVISTVVIIGIVVWCLNTKDKSR